MKVHKEIKVDDDVLKKVLHKDLINRVKYWIREYNKNKSVSICFSYTGNSSKAIEWGLLQTCDISWLDNYFIGVLGMKTEVKASWDNKTADKYYFYEN